MGVNDAEDILEHAQIRKKTGSEETSPSASYWGKDKVGNAAQRQPLAVFLSACGQVEATQWAVLQGQQM